MNKIHRALTRHIALILGIKLLALWGLWHWMHADAVTVDVTHMAAQLAGSVASQGGSK